PSPLFTLLCPPPTSTLFPYTTLFRSVQNTARLLTFYPRRALSSDLYDLVSPSPDTHIANRGASQVLQSIDICPRRRRQIRESPYCSERLLPAWHLLVYRFDSRDRLHIRRHAVDVLSVQPIADGNRYLRKRVQDIQLRHRKPRQPIDAHRIPDHDRIKPSAPPGPPGGGPKLPS